MCIVIHRVHLPFVAQLRVLCVSLDPVDRWVAHVHVGGRHVDLEPQDRRTVLHLAPRHRLEERHTLGDCAIAVRRVGALGGQRASVLSHLHRRERVHICVSLVDQLDRTLVEFVEVVRSVREPFLPIEAKPFDILKDRIHVLLLLLLRVSVVKAHERAPAELFTEAKVDADRLRMPDVQVAVWFGGEARDNLAVLPHGQVLLDDVSDEVRRRNGRRPLASCSRLRYHLRRCHLRRVRTCCAAGEYAWRQSLRCQLGL
mmetsp:Transcript_36621/g.85536  ORF Transcript_36621/g.85536 Transcript_36621/m.85536 type:complete len:257 (+) Transcript_36621:1641-2411(+)